MRNPKPKVVTLPEGVLMQTKETKETKVKKPKPNSHDILNVHERRLSAQRSLRRRLG
jgi:hypothetical protein